MNKDIIRLLIISAILFSATVLMAGCRYEQAHIKDEIDKANHCDVKEDCVDAGGKCPFGCYAYVNINEAARIKGLIDSYDSDCVYGCLYCPDVECTNNTCKPMCE